MSNQQPFCLHPDNPRYFLFRGRPRVLLCATEHYGSVVNRAFDFERYLDDAADKGTRLFLLFRELQTPRNPSSPCKPESPDYLALWQRVGPGLALDGEPIYDLDRWDEEYFARLHRFLTLASARGIVVELTLFSNTYADEIWAVPATSDIRPTTGRFRAASLYYRHAMRQERQPQHGDVDENGKEEWPAHGDDTAAHEAEESSRRLFPCDQPVLHPPDNPGRGHACRRIGGRSE